MKRKNRSEEIQWKARYMARIWAKWLRRNGKTVDGTQCRELETDLASLLRKYREEWGLNVISLHFEPLGVSIHQSRHTRSD